MSAPDSGEPPNGDFVANPASFERLQRARTVRPQGSQQLPLRGSSQPALAAPAQQVEAASGGNAPTGAGRRKA